MKNRITEHLFVRNETTNKRNPNLRLCFRNRTGNKRREVFVVTTITYSSNTLKTLISDVLQINGFFSDFL